MDLQTMMESTAPLRDKMRELAADGIERSSDLVASGAEEAAAKARRWADRAPDVSSLAEEARRSKKRWLVLAGVALTAAGVFVVARAIRRRRRAEEQSAIRDLIEGNAPSEEAGTGRRAAS